MKNEYRTHTYGGIDRAGESRKGGPESLATGNITIGELARESGVTLRALRFYQSKGCSPPIATAAPVSLATLTATGWPSFCRVSGSGSP